MLELKQYQQRSLDALAEYFGLCGTLGAKNAFISLTERPYHSVPHLAEVPYVCLRVPTGGGKTFMACHALGIAAREYLTTDKTVCLWLVPSNAILAQTLAALRDRDHPYRQAVDSVFTCPVAVMDLKEALYLQRGTVMGETVIIVATLAALRVEDTDGRKVYETNGALQSHFSALDRALEELLEKDEDGVYPYSLANVLRLHRPVVIMDEAHNARTKLTFEVLERFKPSCILEFTATPETTHEPDSGYFASNVLHHVSAAELKAEDMIKLPIHLRTRSVWKDAMADAVETQRTLEKTARAEEKRTGEYIRPVVLLQAQPKSQKKDTLTFEVIKHSLVEDFKVPENKVAIATGDQREIEDVNLFERDCPIRFIITVQALKEGWDCSFAYVLCTVSEISTARSVEQILGRILRLPQARRKEHDELNCAQAIATSANFIATAGNLRDALIDNGFQAMEASDFISTPEGQTLFDMSLFQKGAAGKSPWQQGETFAVPRLAIRVDGQLELFDEEHFLDYEWNLADMDAALSEQEFPSAFVVGRASSIDVDERGQIEYGPVEELREQLALIATETGWAVPELAHWIDRQIPHPDLTWEQAGLFIHKVVATLMDERGVTVDQLARQRFRLRGAIARKIDQYRREQAKKAYDGLLFKDGGSPDVVASAELAVKLSEAEYAPSWYYEGPYAWKKSYFPKVGELKSEGEELECAVCLDGIEEVKYWVRNIERRDNSFWLPTSTDKFYPDFLALLNDGRVLVVEYKGADRWSNDDSKEKRAIGELWAARSDGTCLFAMPKGPDWGAIATAIKK